jgi:hypothetical protein
VDGIKSFLAKRQPQFQHVTKVVAMQSKSECENDTEQDLRHLSILVAQIEMMRGVYNFSSCDEE